jgi:PAS domain S-box-containing protein
VLNLYKIIIIVPSEDLIKQNTKYFEEHNKFESDNDIETAGKYSCEVHCFLPTVDILKANIRADVIIARGLGAQELKSRGVQIPVIEIRITGNNLLHALDKSRRMYGDKIVGAIGTPNMLNDIVSIGEVIGVKVRPYYINIYDKKVDQRIHFVTQANDEGCGVILGGHLSCEYADSLGIDSIKIETGRQEVWQAITEAKQAVNIMCAEQEKLLRMKTIFDYSFEGIITTDAQNVVTVMNIQAERILGIKSAEAIGKRFDNIILNSNFKDAVLCNKMYVNELMKYQNAQLTVNKVPLTYRDETFGNVITFQDVTRIQEIEGKIRNKIYALGHTARFSFEDIIGSSKKTEEVIKLANRFANVNSNILIIGETGTGKEVFAQSIHNESGRRNGPFVAINCAALPENLLESELFGYVDGAFTGAVKGGKTGLFELAHKGTIFLDEISELPAKLQGRLLRVIQERKIMRLGHDRVISIDVRIISATNKELKTLVDRGEFREDLYFRLDVLKLRLPPLRQRREDIRPLVESFMRQFALEIGLGQVAIDNEAMAILENCHWYGNIRELKNICERIVVTAGELEITSKEVNNALSDRIMEEGSNKTGLEESTVDQHIEASEATGDLKDEILKLERERISKVLSMYQNNKVKAAKHLGISRTTLWRRMKECGLEL